jgi:selenocysteine lyase/cysteine desulfurase
VYGSRDPDQLDDRLGVISFQVKGFSHVKVAAILGFEGGIGVRNGSFCAQPYISHLMNVSEQDARMHKQQVLNGDRSQLPGLVRASFGCYNTLGEIDRLIEMLERIIRGEYRGDYVQDKATGDFLPRTYDPAILDSVFMF